MNSSFTITKFLLEEGESARAHFQVWWALNNLAHPHYSKVINHQNITDFFLICSNANYLAFIISLSKIFDRDERTSGLFKLKESLTHENNEHLVHYIEENLKPFNSIVKRILTIRNRSIAHNEHNISRPELYKQEKIKPNEISKLIQATCKTINYVASSIGLTNLIFTSNRCEQSTIAVLKNLEHIILI